METLFPTVNPALLSLMEKWPSSLCANLSLTAARTSVTSPGGLPAGCFSTGSNPKRSSSCHTRQSRQLCSTPFATSGGSSSSPSFGSALNLSSCPARRHIARRRSFVVGRSPLVVRRASSAACRAQPCIPKLPAELPHHLPQRHLVAEERHLLVGDAGPRRQLHPRVRAQPVA